MTILLDEAIARVRELPEAEQDLAADALMAIVDHDPSAFRLTPDQIDHVERTLAGLADGSVRILSESETAAMWRRLTG